MLNNWSINSLTKKTVIEIPPVGLPPGAPRTPQPIEVNLTIGGAAVFWLLTILLRDIDNSFINRLFVRYCTRQKVNRFQRGPFSEGMVGVHRDRPETYTIIDSPADRWNDQNYVPITIAWWDCNGKLKFVQKTEKITELNPPPANSVKRRIFNHLAPVVNQRTETIELLRLIEQKQGQLNRLTTLALSSAIDYQPHKYLEKLNQLEIKINQIKTLIELQENYIREGLIAVELLAQTELEESLPDLTPQRQLIETKYQETSAFILAYLELSQTKIEFSPEAQRNRLS